MGGVRTISDAERRNRLAVRHRLVAAVRTNDVASIADDLVALHSSDPATVFLSAMVRMPEPDPALVHAALYEKRTVLRHHAMRRTIWVMTPRVAQLAHAAATAKIARAERKRTVQAIEETTDIVDGSAWFDAALAEIGDLLDAEGSMGTRAIGAALPHLVIPIRMGANTKNPATLNAHTKVLQGAGFDAALIRTAPSGGWHSAEYAWSRTESWLGGPIARLDEQEAAAELLDRWLRRFGPATDTDVRWWFGWTAALARAALAACGAVEVKLDDGPGWVAAGDDEEAADPGPWVRLLPGLDPTVMGWKQRDWYLDADDVSYLFDRFGNAGPTIWADGRVVGAWIQRPDGAIVTELTQTISNDHHDLLAEAIDDLQPALGDVVVRPRFPAPAQKKLFAS